ncbi:hypothetical protein CAPTEDRAFT_42376, partial [Capitella teleta]
LLTPVLDPRLDPGDGLVLIGVMTARKFLNDRISALYATWAKDVQSIRGKVLIFSSAGSEPHAPKGVPVIGLPGVDDTYPPQKKSFMMLKYMHDYYKDKYRFFMRADDDVYIKLDKLANFLHSINGSQALFIGQAGLGTSDEIGRMNLKPGENFCMGGPGMVLTRSTLNRVGPHINECVKNLYTSHEDVEVGRCIRKFAGVSCTWAYEMSKLFFNNYKQPQSSFSHSLRNGEIHNAMTLHPIKQPAYQFRMHRYFLKLKSQGIRQKKLRLRRQIFAMDQELKDRDSFYSPSRLGIPPSLMKTVPKTKEEVLDFEYITTQQLSGRNSNPKRAMERHLREGVDYTVMQVMEMINIDARQRGRTIDFKEILYGYCRLNPLHGADYVLDLLMVYRKHKGKHKRTVPVRRHVYVQQRFGDVQFTEDPYVVSSPELTPRLVPTSASPPTVNFIVPLAGRFQTFLRFMRNFEEVCLRGDIRASLSILLFPDSDNQKMENHVNELRQRYSSGDMRVIPMSGAFSRGRGLQEGSNLFGDNSLLFFIDVDMSFDAASLLRVQLNAIQGLQVYYPVVFSQYDPSSRCDTAACQTKTPYDDDGGYWRQFGFGIAAMYNSDFKAVHGFDVSIEGWGKEDVDLYERFLAQNVTVFRAVDPGLVHNFHRIVCDPGLDAAQYQMCLGSKAATLASARRLGEVVL